VDAQPDRDPVNSAEKHMPGYAGVPRDPCAAIVVAVVAGEVRAFRALREGCSEKRDAPCWKKSRCRRLPARSTGLCWITPEPEV
jgi:hypothetical protein